MHHAKYFVTSVHLICDHLHLRRSKSVTLFLSKTKAQSAGPKKLDFASLLGHNEDPQGQWPVSNLEWSKSGLEKTNQCGEMGCFDEFLVQKSNDIYQSPFSEKCELDEHFEKALPTLSSSLKGVVSKNLGASPPNPLSLILHSFQIY